MKSSSKFSFKLQKEHQCGGFEPQKSTEDFLQYMMKTEGQQSMLTCKLKTFLLTSKKLSRVFLIPFQKAYLEYAVYQVNSIITLKVNSRIKLIVSCLKWCQYKRRSIRISVRYSSFPRSNYLVFYLQSVQAGKN